MKRIEIMLILVLALILNAQLVTAEKPLVVEDFPDTFYVYYVSGDGCTMGVSEGHIAYGLYDQFGGCMVFPVGQTVKGRIFKDQSLDLLYTDSKGKLKGAWYQVVFKKII